MTATATPSQQTTTVPVRVIDVDVHPIGLREDMAEYIEEPVRSRYFRRHRYEVENRDFIYPPNGTTGHRRDANPVPGERTGAVMERQLLGEAGVDYAILTPVATSQRLGDPEFDTALARAENRMWSETWLSRYNEHGRYWGSIKVSSTDPVAAATEIETWAGHPRMLQVYMHPDSQIPYGRAVFDPLYAAATRHGLPVAIHPKKAAGMGMLTPVGFSSYHIENFAQWPMQFMGHLASLVFEGTFERFPTLRVVCLEAGFTWVPAFLWRLDHRWRALRAEVPHVKRPPSEYIREHVVFSTQPIENIDPARELAPLLKWMDAGRLLMFSSDYPHYDFDAPGWLSPRLPRIYRDRVFARTALEVYGLPAERPRGVLDDWSPSVDAGVVDRSTVEPARTLEHDAE